MRHKDFERQLQIPKIGDDLNSHALKYAEPLGINPNALTRCQEQKEKT